MRLLWLFLFFRCCSSHIQAPVFFDILETRSFDGLEHVLASTFLHHTGAEHLNKPTFIEFARRDFYNAFNQYGVEGVRFVDAKPPRVGSPDNYARAVLWGTTEWLLRLEGESVVESWVGPALRQLDMALVADPSHTQKADDSAKPSIKHYDSILLGTRIPSSFAPAGFPGMRLDHTERRNLAIEGRLPPAVLNITQQMALVKLQLDAAPTPLEKWAILHRVRARDYDLFYSVVLSHLKQLVPIIYTPTIGSACWDWSRFYDGTAQGLYLSHAAHRGRVAAILKQWPHRDIDIIVVSDGGRILGLGDLGANGMGIPIGKLDLYVAGAGFHPLRTLPVLLDAGTNTERLLQDPFYVGDRNKRIPDQEYYAFVDEFIQAVKVQWPHCLVQFEDFANEHAFGLLAKYRDTLRCFNDDIQGTGAVVVSGLANAARVAKLAPADLRIVFLGAGSAGIGVAEQIERWLVSEGVPAEAVHAASWLVDSKGLVDVGRSDLSKEKLPWAQQVPADAGPLNTLLNVVKFAKPNVLIGLSAQPNTFTAEVLSEMTLHTPRPIVFALSNPTSKSECSLAQAVEFTQGKVIFASGSPFDPVTASDGSVHHASQANNMYVFPGLGFGARLARATQVSDGMLLAASKAVADAVPPEQLSMSHLFPPVEDIREISLRVACAVAKAAIAEGLSPVIDGPNLCDLIKGRMYFPPPLAQARASAEDSVVA